MVLGVLTDMAAYATGLCYRASISSLALMTSVLLGGFSALCWSRIFNWTVHTILFAFLYLNLPTSLVYKDRRNSLQYCLI